MFLLLQARAKSENQLLLNNSFDRKWSENSFLIMLYHYLSAIFATDGLGKSLTAIQNKHSRTPIIVHDICIPGG